MGKVSVVIPTYNGERFIRETVDSVLAQTHRDIEIIVVDDCSKDDTKGAINDYIDEGRITYISRAENGGIAAGRNTGLKAATGDFIAMLDHDDLWELEKLEKQLRFLDESGSDVVFCDNYIMHEDGVKKRLPSKKKPGTDILDDLLCETTIYTSTIMLRRGVLNEVGLVDESFTYCEDWDWYIRMARKVKVGYFPEYLATRRQHESCFSTVCKGRFVHYLQLYDKHASLLDKRHRRLFRKHIGKKCYIDAVRLMSGGLFGLGLRSYAEAVVKQYSLILKLPSLLKHCAVSRSAVAGNCCK